MPLEGLIGYLMVFFAIWWAWMNFTWFASAYDNDDLLYRLAVFVQIAGALILAAGVAPMFEARVPNAATIGGYVVMRLAWSRSGCVRARRSRAPDDRPSIRARHDDPASRLGRCSRSCQGR